MAPPRTILAIETSMGRTSVALARGSAGKPVEKRLEPSPGQAERLIPLLAELMEEAELPFQSIDLIAVCIGPGGFSGIRSGVAAARGIAVAANLPIAGATSFRIMAAAFEAEHEGPDLYGLVARAGLDTFYCQILSRGCVQRSAIIALAGAKAVDFFSAKVTAIAGPCAPELHQTGKISQAIALELFPDATTLAAIAADLDPERDLPAPFYVRPPDARPQGKSIIARRQ